MVENMSFFLLGSGSRKFISRTAAKQQRSQLRKVQWAGATLSARIPPLPVLVSSCPPPPSQLFFIPFLPSLLICFNHESFKGEPVSSAYPRWASCNPPTFLPFEFVDPELVNVLSQYR